MPAVAAAEMAIVLFTVIPVPEVGLVIVTTGAATAVTVTVEEVDVVRLPEVSVTTAVKT